MPAIDVTETTFEAEVIEKSKSVPVVIDLWAEWCGPCKTLGPILEKVIDATGGKVVLAKIDVDANPGLSQAFKVQSIPAVYAMHNGSVVDGFMGAYPESAVQEFVDKLLSSADAGVDGDADESVTVGEAEEENPVAVLVAAGDESSLRQALELEPTNEEAIMALGELLVADGRADEALEVVAKIPENDRTRRIAAAARVGGQSVDDSDATLTALLDRVKTDDDARQQFVDILELMGADDPRTTEYRRKLAQRLY